MKHNRGTTGTIRHVIKQAIIFLLLGAIVNVAICWTIATRPIDRDLFGRHEDGYSAIGNHGYWMIYHGKSVGRIRIRSRWTFERAGIYFFPIPVPPADDFVPGWVTKINNFRPSYITRADIIAEATGWPLLAMLSSYASGLSDFDESKNYDPLIPAPHGWVISDTSERYVRIIPYQPIMSSFAINTIFYAAIWFILIMGLRANMRIIRRWQGHCPMCKYDLRDDFESGCSECGWNRKDAE